MADSRHIENCSFAVSQQPNSKSEEPLVVQCSLTRSSPREEHHRALAACIRQVPPDWKRPAGRPSHTWLRAIEADLGPLNFGLATAWRKATTRDEWRHIVDTATLQRSKLWKKKKKSIVRYMWNFSRVSSFSLRISAMEHETYFLLLVCISKIFNIFWCCMFRLIWRVHLLCCHSTCLLTTRLRGTAVWDCSVNESCRPPHSRSHTWYSRRSQLRLKHY